MFFPASLRNWKFGCGVSILIGATLSIWMFDRYLNRLRDSIPYDNNLTFVQGAIFRYRMEHGHLPAVVTDSDGRPMHSWRVLLLPYLNEDELAKKYRFDQPWDSVENLQLVDKMPLFYGPRGRKHCTLFAAIVTQGSWWDNDDTKMPSGFAPLLINVEDSKIPWTQPVDLTAMECQKLLLGESIEKPIWFLKSGVRVCSPGGSTIYSYSPDSMRGLVDKFSDDVDVRESAWGFRK